MIKNNRTRLIQRKPVCDFDSEEIDFDEIFYIAQKHGINVDQIIKDAKREEGETCLEQAEYQVDQIADGQVQSVSQLCRKHTALDHSIETFWKHVESLSERKGNELYAETE